MPTAARKPDRKGHNIEALAAELLKIERKIAPERARMEEIKSELRKDAKENFKIEVDGLGVVKVSAPHEPEFKGIMPTANIQNILAADEKERQKLLDKGWIEMVPTYGRPFYGSVTLDLF